MGTAASVDTAIGRGRSIARIATEAKRRYEADENIHWKGHYETYRYADPQSIVETASRERAYANTTDNTYHTATKKALDEPDSADL